MQNQGDGETDNNLKILTQIRFFFNFEADFGDPCDYHNSEKKISKLL